ncbi:MAG TPA: IPExxxVDY family protein [Bacteroidia bacterium]|nr:IPExxxVDY family protein [Bacteroidia bacterium]
MAKYVLNTSEKDFDFALLGIVCMENQYVMLSLINNALKINLQLNAYVPFSLKDNNLFKFSLYHFSDEELGLEYFMVSNTSNFEEPNINTSVSEGLFSGLDIDESVKLVKELPKTDYFLIVKGEDLHYYQFKVMEKLKTIPEIIQVQTIEASDLPSRRNLIF